MLIVSTLLSLIVGAEMNGFSGALIWALSNVFLLGAGYGAALLLIEINKNLVGIREELKKQNASSSSKKTNSK
ncbi:MAG: hypothetical protein MRY49_01710 [Candidatus Pacebacteria bacterium]|nr:hypothetical protein [Candidatus Paceibacterota bacterium]